MVNRKTTLKRLEYIKLSGWPHLNEIDYMVSSFTAKSKSRSEKPGTKICASVTLAVFKVWDIASTEVTMKMAFESALSAGKAYTITPGIAPGVNRPRDEYWLDKMESLMLIASLQADDTELIRFSNWFKVEEYSYGEPPDIALQPILYYLADMFRKRKFASYEPLIKLLTSCRVKEPPLLRSALDGIRSMDKVRTFDFVIAAAKDHANRANIGIPQGSLLNVRNIVAIYPSLLWNVAELRGLQPPTMPPEIRPFMLTRQTLGLPPSQAVAPSETSSKPTKSAKAETRSTKAPKAVKATKSVKAPKSIKAKTATKSTKAKNAKRKADDVS